MAVNTALPESLSLYHFMCQHIVGTEATVRTKRLMSTVVDNLASDEVLFTSITSGSYGEGLQMKGSDKDVMNVINACIVHENMETAKFDPLKVNLVMEMSDTKPGFTLLRCVNLHDGSKFLLTICTQNGNSWYVSNELCKTYFLKDFIRHHQPLTKIHGPCLSDINESIDLAFCFKNPNWIQPAENWINRGNMSWPSSDVKSNIIEHGVLFVPIGVKGSNNESLEWRISFSVAEKFLIYSFCHTQLLCYALMKILLKDLINSNRNCENLLCSYFIKTVIFWVSEETSVNEWKPENLIPCFIKCVKRLVYFVEYSICPHYFMPTINLFENKIEGQSRHVLLGHLQALFSFGWRCVFLSKQFQQFTIQLNVLPNTTEVRKTQLHHLITSDTATDISLFSPSKQGYSRCIYQLNRIKSSYVKSNYLRYLSVNSANVMTSFSASPSHTNKKLYYQYRKNQSYLLQSVHCDAVSGWFLLSALLYKMKQYNKALYLLNHTLQKCTPEKSYYKKCPSEVSINLITPPTLKKHGILRILKHGVIFPVLFYPESTVVPDELTVDQSQLLCLIPPVIFAHFMCCLCHYRLNNRQQCYNSIKSLQRTIDDRFFIAGSEELAQGYTVLGIALLLVGQNDLASHAFTNATKCDVYLHQ